MRLDWKQHDVSPITGTLKVGTKAVDLHGATVRWLSRPRPGTTGPTVSRLCTVLQVGSGTTAQKKGRFSYVPLSADVTNAGLFDAELEALWGDGTRITFPRRDAIRWVINADLA